MNTVATVALLGVFLTATAAVSGNGSTETLMTANPGDIAVLPCYTVGNETPSLTTWTKDGREVSSGGVSASPPPAGQRLVVLHDGSLNIIGVLTGDEGSYLCSSILPVNRSFQARVLLQVTSGPDEVSASISANSVLHNGTVVAYRGSSVTLNCSAFSYPSQQLSWAFKGASYSNDTLASTSESSLGFKMENVQPSTQGVYTCMALNTVSNKSVSKSTELLVYYVPGTHPDCRWEPTQDPSYVHFICSWFGLYPTPKLLWGKDGAFQETDRLTAKVNRSLLSDGQILTCKAQHQLLNLQEEKSCSFTLMSPYPVGDPLVTALEATSITLTCSETTSSPPANTTWRRGLQQDSIVTGSKYVLSEDGPTFKLTIFNISKDDEGVYFCRSENPFAVRELEVYLTVKASSAYTGAIIGVFIAALIVGSAIIVTKTLYSSRHRICLGGGFGQMMEEENGDVLSLVDSDDEQIFQDTVPQLPPLTNGCHTTLVQIHRIPSSDHEDAESSDTRPQQQEDTEQTQEPADLVKF
ncbi:V-set and immunoglobulin domain-containing protein 10 isoform X2 [Melanotaenia boesemani]|uniref:V-set and immunoglobulin domain-containing protein 10 isoform X2 n=1 Tax=Melanotaenia boesemani TaxID=1250792 RepID=UPI001C03C50A|nr:V-set and immunoglobulin domain-containing protein 10 isoform X2 [Melanotaenia boesemani]